MSARFEKNYWEFYKKGQNDVKSMYLDLKKFLRNNTDQLYGEYMAKEYRSSFEWSFKLFIEISDLISNRKIE